MPPKPPALIMAIGAPKGKPMDNKMDDDESQENEICLPSAALAAQGDQGATPPAQGDAVDFPASGTVTRVDGDNVYVKIQKVNGQPIEGSDEEESSESPDEEKGEEDKEAAGLRGQAQKVDDMGY